jgi:hypothetical protein
MLGLRPIKDKTPLGMEMSTQTLEKPDTKTDDGSGTDRNKVFHYVKKNQIAESAVTGKMLRALCGIEFPVTAEAKKGSPVCPACKDIYENVVQKG